MADDVLPILLCYSSIVEFLDDFEKLGVFLEGEIVDLFPAAIPYFLVLLFLLYAILLFIDIDDYLILFVVLLTVLLLLYYKSDC